MNRVIYDIFYGEIHLPSEHQVYALYKPPCPHWNVRAMNLINEIYIIYLYPKEATLQRKNVIVYIAYTT